MGHLPGGEAEEEGMAQYLQVTTTFNSEDEAGRVARALVERRLAACTQVLGPISSTYWWQGEVEEAQEWLLFAKTTDERYPALEGAIRELHSYTVPEILAVPVVAGNFAYLEWVLASVSLPGGDEAL